MRVDGDAGEGALVGTRKLEKVEMLNCLLICWCVCVCVCVCGVCV